MSDFRITTAIDAPAERVWAVLADVERWPEWTASVSRVELLTSAPLGMGGRVRIDQPKLRPAVWTVTLWQPGQRFVWESTNPGVKVVAVGAEMVVDHVQPDRQAVRVRGVHEAVQPVGAPVRLVHRVQADAVVAPAAAARKRRDRHQLDHVDAQVGQMLQVRDGGIEGAFDSEGADVQLVGHRALQRRARPVVVGPGEGARVDPVSYTHLTLPTNREV